MKSASLHLFNLCFTKTVQLKNPSVITLLSIGGIDANSTTFSSMTNAGLLFDKCTVAANNESKNTALHDPIFGISTDVGIRSWISNGVSVNKLVLGLPYYGYTFTLIDPEDHGLAVSAKVSYAKEMDLLGYFAWHVGYDDDWVLSQITQAEILSSDQERKKRLPLWAILVIIAVVLLILLLFSIIYYLKRREQLNLTKVHIPSAFQFGVDEENSPELQVFSLDFIKFVTDSFSGANKLGVGGFGPAYKAWELWNGDEAMKFADPILDTDPV
ncbi:hypothetical protein GIB67_031280 [Kingdonia uniflora]|uniref:GH18 domain-containing protein n=1 Tax=Kingdonia uniflora TaxID=39325 RepID=A0A7J7P5N6_9MAGN|nr:hypothetical protein GIB67_031280 [Kingdonia uniflora]